MRGHIYIINIHARTTTVHPAPHLGVAPCLATLDEERVPRIIAPTVVLRRCHMISDTYTRHLVMTGHGHTQRRQATAAAAVSRGPTRDTGQPVSARDGGESLDMGELVTPSSHTTMMLRSSIMANWVGEITCHSVCLQHAVLVVRADQAGPPRRLGPRRSDKDAGNHDVRS